MNIYLLKSKLKDHQKIALQDDYDWHYLDDKFDGQRINSWKYCEMLIYDNEEKYSDFPHFASHIPVFSKKAIGCLGEILEKNGDVLKISCCDKEFCLFNVTTILDVFNDEKSKSIKYPNGKIMYVEKYILKKSNYKSSAIFKLRNLTKSEVFVNDEFVDVVVANGLVGLEFIKVDLID